MTPRPVPGAANAIGWASLNYNKSFYKEIAMDPSDTILPTLIAYLVQSPILLVWLIGLVLATVYWRRHPRVSLLTVIALVVFLIETLVNTYINMWLPLLLSRRGMESSQMVQLLGIKNIVTSIIIAIGWSMVVAAIFSGRKAATMDTQQSEHQVIKT